MGQMGATGFAQIAAELGEDETVEGHDLFLSQLAHSLVSLSEAQADRMDQLLSQIDESDEQRALDERQRKRKNELDNLLKGCRDRQDDFERHLGKIIG